MRSRRILSALTLALAAPVLSAQAPRPAEEFVIHLPGGGQKLLSAYKGSVIVLQFLFTT